MSLHELFSIHNVRVFTLDGGTGRAMGAATSVTDSGRVLTCRVRPIASSKQTVPSIRLKNRLVNHIVDFDFDPEIGAQAELHWVEKNVRMKVEGVARDIQGLERRWQLMATSYDANNLAIDVELA